MKLKKGSNLIKLPERVSSIEGITLSRRGYNTIVQQLHWDDGFFLDYAIRSTPVYARLLPDKQTLQFYPAAAQQFNVEILYYLELKKC